MRRKLILVGVDGATWQTLNPLIYRGELPFLRKLVATSSVSTLQSTIPAESPPSWTSIFTGVNPGKHGIVDFIIREGNHFVPCFSRYRMCETIWTMMSESGANCIVINDPVTFPPEKVRGIMTTGLMTPPGSTNWIYPKELRSELDAAAGGYEPDIPANFKSLFIEDKRKSLGILEELTAKIFRLSTYAIENYDWDVFAVIFTSTDRLQHYWWDDPTVLSQHYRAIDAIVGEYIKYAEQTMADLIVVSDHGFGPVNKVFCVNEWLKRSGLAVAKESTFARFLAKSGLTRQRMRNVWGEWPTAFRVLPAVLQDLVRAYIPDAAESNNELDIGDSAVYAKSSAGVFVRDKHRLEFVAQKLRKAIDESTGQSIFENVLKRDEVLRGPYCYRAPDLFFKPVIGYDPCPNDNDRIGRTGTHRPEGIFLHYRSGSSLEQHSDKEIRPWDVAALVLDVLGLPIPEYFDGKARL